MRKMTLLRSVLMLSALLITGLVYSQVSRDITNLPELFPGKITKPQTKAISSTGSAARKNVKMQAMLGLQDTTTFFRETFGIDETGNEGIDINSYTSYDSFEKGIKVSGLGKVYKGESEFTSFGNNYAHLPKAERNAEDGNYYTKGMIKFEGIDFGSYTKVLLEFSFSGTDSLARIGIYTQVDGGRVTYRLPEQNVFFLARVDVTDLVRDNNLLEILCADTASTSDGLCLDDIRLIGITQHPQEPELRFNEYAVASNSEALTFEHSSYFPWTLCEENYVKGVVSTNGGMSATESWFSTTVSSSDYINLSFDWRVSSEPRYDMLRLYINGEEYLRATDNSPYITENLQLVPGIYTLKWVYSKDGSDDYNEDAGYVRNIKVIYASDPVVSNKVLFKETFGTADVSSRPKINVYQGYDYAGSLKYEAINPSSGDIRTIAGDTIHKNHLWLPAKLNCGIIIDGLNQYTEGYSNKVLSFEAAMQSSGTFDLNIIANGTDTIKFPQTIFDTYNTYKTIECTTPLPVNLYSLELSVTESMGIQGYRIDNITISGKGSAPVDLGVVADDAFISAAASPDCEPLIFKNSSLYPWELQEREDEAGEVMRNVVSSNQGISNSQSWFSTTVENYANNIECSFDWKVNSEVANDRLILEVNGALFTELSGMDITDFSGFSQTFSPGKYTFKWAYLKNGSIDNGEDCGIVRNIKIAYSTYTEPARLEVSKNYIDFGTIRTPETLTDSVFIYNPGGADLVIDTISAANAPFRRSQWNNLLCPAGTGSYLYFTFAPETVHKGVFTQTITIQSNGGWRDITLRGCANLNPKIVEAPSEGMLYSVVTDTSVDSLTIIGSLNYSDFDFLRYNLLNLGYLNLSMVNLWNNALPKNALENKSILKEVILPENLVRIEGNAISNCSNLRSVILPQSLITIESYAFSYCTNLIDINLNEGLQTIQNGAFYNCTSLGGDLILPSTLTRINNEAFVGCGYTSCKSKAITPPVIEYNSLGNISLVFVPKGSAGLYRSASYWSQKTIIDGEDLTTVTVELTTAGTLGEKALEQVSDLFLINKLIISGPLNSTDWNYIRNSMPSLMSIDLGASTIKEIPDSQFDGKNTLREVILPQGLIRIGSSAFSNCTNLAEIIIPESVETIDNSAFYYCTGLRTANIPIALKTLGSSAFYQCTLLQSPIVIPEGITQIASSTFYYCYALSEVSLPETLQTIGNNSFNQCRMLKSITLPSQLKTIDSNAFQNCALDSIVFPATLTTINYGAFNCSSLKQIICGQAVPPVLNGNDPFSSVDKKVCVLKVPDWSKDLYKLANIWMEFSNIIGYSSAVDHISVSNVFTLSETVRPQGTPSVTIQQGGTLQVRGNLPFATNQFMMDQKMYSNKWGNDFSGCVFANLINESPEMTANKVSMNFTINGQKWYFMSFPYDINYSDITIDAGKFFVFRKYDGASRALIGTSGTTGDSWKNMIAGDLLKAGNGYIFQCSGDVTGLQLPATDASKNQLFTNVMREIVLNDYIPTDNNAENQSWNLVGNPYPAYFDINMIDYVAPITIWNGSSYEALSLVDDSYILRPFEAFYVQKPTGVASINFLPEGRQYTSVQSEKSKSADLRKAKANTERKVFNFFIADGTVSDKCRVVVNPKAKADYEINSDAAKFMSLNKDIPQIYSVDGKGINYAINERPEGNVAIGVYTGNVGDYTISLQSEVAYVEVLLLDKLTGKEVDLSKDDYTFTALEGMSNDRFEVSFNAAPTNINSTTVSVEISSIKGALSIQATEGSTIKIVDYTGVTVKNLVTGGTVTEIGLPQGAYIVIINGKVYKAIVL